MKHFNAPSKKYIDLLKQKLNYSEHNFLVKQAYRDFDNGNPSRMPMHLGINPRYLILNPNYNKSRVTFEKYTNDSRLMFECVAEFQYFLNLYVPFFHEMGPDAPICVYVDFQNFAETAWMGSEIFYKDTEVPYGCAFLNSDNKNIIFDRGIPDPFSGVFGKHKEYYEKFHEYAKEFTVEGHPVNSFYYSAMSIDGIFTLACDLLGPTNACIFLYEEEDYMDKLFSFLTEATIQRIKAHRKYIGLDEQLNCLYFADDSIAMLSNELYIEKILPYHKKLKDALVTPDGETRVHLCGDATRHFKTIQDELNCVEFDTGFPVDHEKMLKTLKSGTRLNGGPTVAFLETASPQQVKEEVKRIMNKVMPVSKFFVMREANNLPPSVNLENVLAMYETVIQNGKY